MMASSSSSSSSSAIGDILRNLPTHNSENFTRLNGGYEGASVVADHIRPPSSSSTSTPSSLTNASSCSRHRVPLYIPTSDSPSERVIVTEKTNILLRYLHQQWDKKAAAAAAANQQRKREAAAAAAAANGGGDDVNGSGPSGRKRSRLEAPLGEASTGGSSAANRMNSAEAGTSSSSRSGRAVRSMAAGSSSSSSQSHHQR